MTALAPATAPAVRRSVPALVALTAATFLYVTTETLPVGLLAPIGADLGVSEARVGSASCCCCAGWPVSVASRSPGPLVDLAVSGSSTAVNVGITLGALLGAALLDGRGVRSTALAGGLLTLAALALAALHRPRPPGRLRAERAHVCPMWTVARRAERIRDPTGARLVG